jgi:hypothetical protein
MSGVRKHYVRVVIAWTATLAALYWLQQHFNAS